MRTLCLGSLLLAFLLLASCGAPRRAPQELPDRAAGSRIDLFVHAEGAESAALSVDLEGVWARDTSGELRPLELPGPTLSSARARRRVGLAGGPVPDATYDALVLRVSGARLDVGGTERALRLLPADAEAPDRPAVEPSDAEGPAGFPGAETVDYVVPLQLTVRPRDAASAFLEWNVDASLVDGGFRFVASVSLEGPQARLGLLYVADAATGSVLAVNRGNGQVVATSKVGDRPLALAPSRNRRRLFVANGGGGSLSILDTRRNAVESTVPIRLYAGTSDVDVAEERRTVVVTNTGLDTISFFDVRNPARIEDVRVGRSPVRLVAVEPLRRVFVANSLSDDVTVVDVSSRSVVGRVPVESRPTFLVADRLGQEIFVGHRSSPNLLIFDAESLAVTGAAYVGGNVTAMLADRRRDRVYVARSKPAEIVVVDRRLLAVIRRIPISGRVEGLAQPLEGTLIYGAAPDLGGLVVVDVVQGEERTVLPCGTAPTDVVSID